MREFGWTFVSVTPHTLNQMSMSRSVIVVSLELLGGGGGGGGVKDRDGCNSFACVHGLSNNIMCVSRYRWSMYAYAGYVVCCFVVLHCWWVCLCGQSSGSTLSDLSLATGLGPFNLPTCGPLPKGRDHSHVESGKQTEMSVLFIVVVVCVVVCCLLCISSLE